jgi:hypothetical protein
MKAWGGNMDFSILIDSNAVIAYVAKYCTKIESISVGLNAIVKSAIKKKVEDGDINTKKILRTIFNAQNTRDKCCQEVAHLSASHPVAICSHKFVIINLQSKLRALNDREV